MSIRVYDFDFNLLAETQQPLSTEWSLVYNGIGSFEASFDVYSDFAGVFADNRYLLLTDGENQAVCVGSKIKDRLYVYGRTPEWLLSKRVVLPFKSKEIFGEEYTDPETIILYLLESVYKTPHPIGEDGTVDYDSIDAQAACENFIIPQKIGCKKLERHFWRNSANALSDVIADLCSLMDCGYSLRFDSREKCWRFELKFGKERDIIVSKSLKNAYDMSLTESLLETAQGGFYEIRTGNETEGISYGYVKDSGSGSAMLHWDRLLGAASGLSEARSTLAKYTVSQKVECEMPDLAVGTDYELGDILRVQIETGGFRKTVTKRVGGISIINSASACSVKPSFVDI